MPLQDFINKNATISSPRKTIREKKRFKLLVFFVLFVVSICVTGVFFFRSSWNSRSALSFLVLFGDPQNKTLQKTSIAIVTIQPSISSVNVLPIPDDVRIDTVGGYGQYPASSLYGLMRLDNLQLSFLKQTLSFQFGIPVEHIVYTTIPQKQFSIAGLTQIIQQQVFFQQWSTFSYADRIKLWMYLRGLRKDKMTVVDLASSNMIIAQNQLDILRLDQVISSLFSDRDAQKEIVTVAVINTTGEARLGTRIARALSLMGLNVVRVADDQQKLDRTVLVANTTSTKQTRTYILLTLLLKGLGFQHQVDSEKTTSVRADMILFLGKDIVKMFTSH